MKKKYNELAEKAVGNRDNSYIINIICTYLSCMKYNLYFNLNQLVDFSRLSGRLND